MRNNQFLKYFLISFHINLIFEQFYGRTESGEKRAFKQRLLSSILNISEFNSLQAF